MPSVSPTVRCVSAVFLVVTAAPARGQSLGTLGDIGQEISRRVNASVDAGAAVVTYDDFPRSSVISVSPTVRVEGARTMVLARGAFSQFASGNTSIQAELAGSVVSPELFKVRGELFGTASATRYIRDLAATNLFGVGRLHAAGPTAGAWVGTGLGFVAQGTRLPVDVSLLDVGAWAREGSLTYTLTVQPTRVGATRYADAVAGARWQGSLGELAVSSGYRARANDSLPGVRAWGEASVTVWLNTRLAVVGGAGVFPFEPVQGLPGGRYASAGLRVAQRRPAVSDPTLRAELTLPYEVRRLHTGARADLFDVGDNDDGSRTLRLRVPGAHRVELMGDFTAWTPVPLTRLGAPVGGRDAAAVDVWAVTVVLSPGVHRVNVRVDGGAWQAPPGLSVMRDDFGGSVGLLVVR